MLLSLTKQLAVRRMSEREPDDIHVMETGAVTITCRVTARINPVKTKSRRRVVHVLMTSTRA